MNRPDLALPWLPEARIVTLPGRGECFVRVHQHPDASRPTFLLLHGWTASADLQFFTAYEAVAERGSFIAIDHQGHGRGLRSERPFSLERVADDAYEVARSLGCERAIVIGYSMGGPIALHLTRRHPHFVDAMILQATALEWRATRRERLLWRLLPILGSLLRSSVYPRYLRRALPRLIPAGHPLTPYRSWLEAEVRRGDVTAIIEAGKALSLYDARAWAKGLGVPASMLITTHDELVKPAKQWALAAAVSATTRELPDDHLGFWAQPERFSELTAELIDLIIDRLEVIRDGPEAAGRSVADPAPLDQRSSS